MDLEEHHVTHRAHMPPMPVTASTERLRTKGVPFARLQVCERVGISQGKVYERVENLSFQSVKSPKGADRCIACL